jgi:hypothetical protein
MKDDLRIWCCKPPFLFGWSRWKLATSVVILLSLLTNEGSSLFISTSYTCISALDGGNCCSQDGNERNDEKGQGRKVNEFACMGSRLVLEDGQERKTDNGCSYNIAVSCNSATKTMIFVKIPAGRPS